MAHDVITLMNTNDNDLMNSLLVLPTLFSGFERRKSQNYHCKANCILFEHHVKLKAIEFGTKKAVLN